MKNSSGILTLLIFSFFLSVSTYAAPASKGKVPATILVKRDQNGQIFIYESKTPLPKIKKGDEAQLDKLKFVKLADVAKHVNLNNVSKTAELDNDLPRQSWYVYWGYPYANYNYGYYYYPYYPINYYAYNYNYIYYPYYSYYYSGCNYYGYGYPGYGGYGGYGDHVTPY